MTRIGFILLALLTQAVTAHAFKTIALIGDDVSLPGNPALFLDSIADAEVSDNGRVVFTGTVTAQSGSRSVLLTHDGTDLSLLHRASDPVVGQPIGTTFTGFNLPEINNSGEVSYRGGLRDELGSFRSIVAKTSGGVPNVLARTGQQAPGSAANYSSFPTRPQLNNAGHVAFNAVLSTADEGVWAERGSSLQKIAVTNDSIGPGNHLRGVGNTLTTVGLNDSGTVAFDVSYTHPGEPFLRTGILSDSGSGLVPIVLQQVTNTNFGTVTGFERVINSDLSGTLPEINDSGETAFVTGFTESFSPLIQGNRVWKKSGDNFEEIARRDEPAPGVPGKTLEINGRYQPLINNSGHVTIMQSLRISGGRGIWSDRSGSLELVSLEGVTAPGLEAGESRRRNTAFLPSFNDNDTIVFGSEIFPSDDRGVWASLSNGVTNLLVREGSMIDVNADPLVTELRTVSTISTVGESFRRFKLTETDEVLLKLSFVGGGSGIFLVPATETSIHPGTGDYNADGIVDAADYTIWRDSLGQSGAGLAADGDGNGVIDQQDYNIWVDTFGQQIVTNSSSAATNTIPEPGALALLAMLCCIPMVRRK